MKAIRRFTVRTVLPQALTSLEELATNLRWSWHNPTMQLFSSISPEIWEETGHDPVSLLGAIEPARLDELANDSAFVARANALRDDLHAYLTEPRWYQSLTDAPKAIAYFSPEFGIAAALPQYSGGLGILAGDHLKSASDLGVPIIAAGLFYRAGYFRQAISRDGWQQETYPVLDPDGLPLSVLRNPDGTAAQVTLALPKGEALFARIWKVAVGRVTLLLLDTDVPENEESLRTRHRPPLRRRRRAPTAAGAAARHRRRARHQDLHRAHRRSRRPRCSTPTRATPDSWVSSASAT